MMQLKVYIVNAFAETTFGGNPAAIICLEEWLPDDLMQQIAAQLNLSETAYVIPQNGEYAILVYTRGGS